MGGVPLKNAAISLPSECRQLRLHLIDLTLLARNDRLTKILDALICDGRVFAHQDGTGMMRDHRFQELLVRDRRLLPD